MNRIEEFKAKLENSRVFKGLPMTLEPVENDPKEVDFITYDDQRIRITMGDTEFFVFGRQIKDQPWTYFVTNYKVTGEPDGMGFWALYEGRDDLLGKMEAQIQVLKIKQQAREASDDDTE